MMTKPLAALLALICLTSFTASGFAEDLLQVYDLAVKVDPTLRESEQTLYATREYQPQAQADLLPKVSMYGEMN